MNPIPQYISSFELEEARLGQALQANQIFLDKDIHRDVLFIIRDQSVNAEYALHLIATNLRSKKDNRFEILEKMLLWMQQRKKNGPQ